MLLEQHLMPDYTQHLILGQTNPFDLLFCPNMVSLGLSVRQSDIFKDFTYLSLTWIKLFSVQFAKESTYFERVDKLPMMLFWDVFRLTRWTKYKKVEFSPLYTPQTVFHSFLIGCHLSSRSTEKRQLVCACSVKVKLMRETAEVRLC